MLAETLRVLGRTKAALQELDALVRQEPNNPYVYLNIAAIVSQAGDSEGAKRQIRKAVEVAEASSRQCAITDMSIGVK